MLDIEDQPEPFRVTPGFIAFVTAMCLPLLVALFVYAGAALVANDVRAAEASQSSGFTNVERQDGQQVEGWKKTLVGICPLH
jgi:hypothetical protein